MGWSIQMPCELEVPHSSCRWPKTTTSFRNKQSRAQCVVDVVENVENEIVEEEEEENVEDEQDENVEIDCCFDNCNCTCNKTKLNRLNKLQSLIFDSSTLIKENDYVQIQNILKEMFDEMNWK